MRRLIVARCQRGSLALFALGMLCTSGCQWSAGNLRGEGFTDENAKWSRNLRQNQADGEPLGTSAKALEIERNLGFR